MDALKNWLMIFLASVFVFLYSAVLLGWLRPLSDIGMVYRLESIIFIIIGYYFGERAGRHGGRMSKRRATDRAAAEHIETAKNLPEETRHSK